MTATTATRAELDPAHAEVVAATLPLIGARIDEITAEFYRRMFANHPELIRNLFACTQDCVSGGLRRRSRTRSSASRLSGLTRCSLKPARITARRSSG